MSRLLISQFCILLALLIGIENQAHADSDSGRSKNRFGIFAGFNPDIAPATVGGGIGFHVGDFARIYGAGGVMTKGTQQFLPSAYNATFGNLFTAVIVGFAYVVTGGNIKWRTLWDNLSLKADVPNENVRVDTFGGGLKLFVPGLSASPTVGVGYAKVKSNGAFSLPTSGENLFYTGGLDVVNDGGFHFNIGTVYSPRYDERLRWRLSLQLGVYF